MDRQTQAREMRKLAAAPDYMIGSVQAVTEHGQLVVPSASGSQIGPYAAGAGQLILIIGGQKLVPDMQTALQRVTEHVQPYEDQRLREQMGIPTLVPASSSSSATTAPAGPPSSSSASRSVTGLALTGRPARSRDPRRTVSGAARKPSPTRIAHNSQPAGRRRGHLQ